MSDLSRQAFEELPEIGRIQKLKPTLSDLESTGIPIKREYRENGHCSYSADFAPNDGHGKLTRHAEAVGELFKPFNAAAMEHQAKVQAKTSRVKLSSPSGPQYVEESKAEAVSRRNGWGRTTGIGWSRAYERGYERMRRRGG